MWFAGFLVLWFCGLGWFAACFCLGRVWYNRFCGLMVSRLCVGFRFAVGLVGCDLVGLVGGL